MHCNSADTHRVKSCPIRLKFQSIVVFKMSERSMSKFFLANNIEKKLKMVLPQSNCPTDWIS